MAKGWSFGGLVAALKDAAFKSTGTTAGTVAAGDDTRIVRAVQRTGDTMSGELKIGVGSAANALRIFDAAYGAIFRRSENSLHIIPTDANNGQNGNIGSLRPFTLALDTGVITNSHGIDMAGRSGFIKSNYFTNSSSFNDSNLPAGTGGFGNQLNSGAMFNQDNITLAVGSGGTYIPTIKQKTTRANAGWTTSISLGTLMPGSNQFAQACIHIIGDAGTQGLWTFDPNNGVFSTPGGVKAGTATFGGDGNIGGTAWGSGGNVGDLKSYLSNNLIAQDFCSVAGFSGGNTQFPYMRQRSTNEVVMLARQDWTATYFLQDVRYAGSGIADNGNNDNAYAEAPSPSTVYAVQQKTNYTSVKYTNLQMNRNGTWITVGRV
jgi:hypothetical protein